MREPLRAFTAEFNRLRAEREELERGGNGRAAMAVFIKMNRIESLKSQLLGERLIGTLSQHNWLPAYAFPRDSVQLLVLNPGPGQALKLERARERGISEYAPASEIIADGKLFTSAGVNLMGQTPQITHYRFCPATRRVRIGPNEDALKAELPQIHGAGQKAGKFIQPKGFLTSINDQGTQPDLNRLRPPPNTELFVVNSVDPEDFEPHPELPGITTGIYPDARLFTANLGRSGRGFQVCTACGCGQDEGSLGRGHKRPFGGRPCNGFVERVALASLFNTDVLQVRCPAGRTPTVLDEQGQTFWTTLAAAVARSACTLLRIDPADLEVSFRSISDADHRGELLLFDNVPGGAGFVQQVRRRLPEVLRAAADVLRDCPNTVDCGPLSSCYACLRTFGNQFRWQYLCREAALGWLVEMAG